MDLSHQKITLWRLIFKCNVPLSNLLWNMMLIWLVVAYRLIFVVVSQTTSLHSGATTTLWTTVRWCRPTTCASSCPGSWTASACPAAAQSSPAETTTSTFAERWSQDSSCRSVLTGQTERKDPEGLSQNVLSCSMAPYCPPTTQHLALTFG